MLTAANFPTIFPVRHHSPAAASLVGRLIRERRPRVVLVEGPSDATDLIPLLLDPETEPPVALYVYRTGALVRSIFYPFCRYSPEYVALQVGQEVGAELHFCDLPAATMLDVEGEDEVPGEAGSVADLLGYNEFATALTEAAGFDSFEELWEAAFEQEMGPHGPSRYVEALADFGAKARSLTSDRQDGFDGRRERYMAAVARAAVARGIPPEAVLLVCGAAHAEAVASAFRDGGFEPGAEPGTAADAGDLSLASVLEREEDLAARLRGEPSATTEISLIPYSYPRLSEQSGYGAGNRAPWYYEQVWERGGDYQTATRHSLVMLARELRAQGRVGSLAQAVDAYNLTRVLAGIRGKIAPGVDETVDAALACFGQDHPGPVGDVLRQILVGEAVGSLSRRVGRTPLQAEFYATAQRLRLPVLDAPRQVLLHMVNPTETEASIFLHRLAVVQIPYARELESGLGGRGRAAQADPLQQLARVREKWELQWTPATDAQLIERTAWGSTLVEACGRLLGQQLVGAERVDVGTSVLLQMALCDLVDQLPSALERCETLAADSASFPPLARAAYHLDGLLSYGSARQFPAEQLSGLAGRLFARAMLHLPAAAACGDEAANEVREALPPLYELVSRSSPVVDVDGFWRAVETVAEMTSSHPGLRGLALVLLELGGRLPAGALAERLRYWMSATAEAGDNARLVAGLFALHRGTLIRNRALIGAVTDFLLGLEIDQLTPLLPVLRGSLGTLSAAERRYLAETLAGVLGLDGGQVGRVLTLQPDQRAWLSEIDAAVAGTLRAWQDRYGIE